MALFQRGDSFFQKLTKPEPNPVPLEGRAKQNEAPEVLEKTAHHGVLLGSLMSFISTTAFAVGFPFLQSRRDALGCDALCQGGQTSLRSALTLVGASLIGRASDKFGRLPMLWLGLASSLATFGITYSLDTLQGMWIAMVPSGLLDHRWNVAKALLTDYTVEQGGGDADRAGAVGKLGMAVGLSMVAGPMLGTLVFNTHQQALALSMAFTVGSGLFIAMLPMPAAQVQHQTKPSSGMMDFVQMPVLRTRGAQLLMGVRFLMALAFHMFAPVWQVSVKSRFDFGPRDHAQFMGMVGFSYALSQGVVSKPLIRLAGQDLTKLILLCILILGGFRPFALWTTSVAVVYLLYVPMVIALGVMNTAITTACSCLADGDQLGGFFGVMESVESVAGLVGPTIGGLAAVYHTDLPLAAVCSSYAVSFVLVLLFFGEHVVQSTADVPTSSKKDQ